MNRRRWIWSEKTPWFVAALVVLTGSWAADGIKDGVESWIKGEPFQDGLYIARVLYCGSFVVAARCLYRMRQQLFRPRTRFVRNESPEKREHLVLFLSHLDTRRGKFHDGVLDGITLSDDLDTDLDMLSAWKQQGQPYWPWEMPLRGIKHHLGRIKTVTIICSPESIQQVHWFGQVLTRYKVFRDLEIRVFVQGEGCPALVACPPTPMSQKGWDFEQFDDLSRAVGELLHEFQNRAITDNQVMIDFTGGQKVTSVVAASVTFNREIKAQYVQTNPPYAAISYDIVLGSSDTSGLGL